MDLTSAFIFESYLGNLKTLVRSPINIIQQVHRRLIENSDFQNKVTMNSSTTFALEHCEGPVLDPNFKCKQFKKIIYKSNEFHIHSHSSANAFCITKSGFVVEIYNILKQTNNAFFICKNFCKPYSPLYEYPFPSQEINVYVIDHNNVSDELICVRPEDILLKCIVIPIDNKSSAVIPFHHYSCS